MTTAVCPPPDALEQLLSGELDEMDESSLTTHLDDCDRCRSTLRQLTSSDRDVWSRSLRWATDPLPYGDEPDCQWAMTLALGAVDGAATTIPSQDTGEDVSPSEPFELPVTRDDYELLQRVASGGMGIVYRARQIRLGREVAVKIIAGKRLTDRRAIQRFEAEIRALGQLNHPHIVAALDARQWDGQPALVMEYVRGLDLSQIVAKLGPLASVEVAAIGSAVAEALHYASQHAMVHRDVKPSNVMVSETGEVKLLDLGLARLQVPLATDQECTHSGWALGTADYMSPEQIHDARDVDVRSDLYSLGCMLFKLWSGAAPYAGSHYPTNFAKLAAHVSPAPIAIPESLRRQCPALAEIISELLVKDRSARTADAAEVAARLRPLGAQANLVELVRIARTAPALNAVPVAGSPVEPSGQPPRSRKRSLWLAASGGALPFLIALGIVLTIRRPDGSETQITLPPGASASVDPHGNVDVLLGPTDEPAAETAGLPAPDAAGSGTARGWSGFGMPNRGLPAAEAAGAATEQSVADDIPSPHPRRPTYRNQTIDAWFDVLEYEGDPELVVSAAEAVGLLADSEADKVRFAELMFRRNRMWSNRPVEGGRSNNTFSWARTLAQQTEKLPINITRDAILDSLAQGNEKSYEACLQFMDARISRFSRGIHDKLVPLAPVFAQATEFDSFRELPEAMQIEWKQLVLTIAWMQDWDFDSLTQPLQDYSQASWQAFQADPFQALVEQLQAGTLTPMTGTNQPARAPWMPYWSSLPRDQIDLVEVLRAVNTCWNVPDSYNRNVLPIRDRLWEKIRGRLPEPTGADRRAIREYLVQTLAESNFDSDDLLSSVKLPNGNLLSMTPAHRRAMLENHQSHREQGRVTVDLDRLGVDEHGFGKILTPLGYGYLPHGYWIAFTDWLEEADVLTDAESKEVRVAVLEASVDLHLIVGEPSFGWLAHSRANRWRNETWNRHTESRRSPHGNDFLMGDLPPETIDQLSDEQRAVYDQCIASLQKYVTHLETVLDVPANPERRYRVATFPFMEPAN